MKKYLFIVLLVEICSCDNAEQTQSNLDETTNGIILPAFRKRTDTSFDKNSYHIIDCKNLMLCPGFVDIKCHLRVPGEEHKENLSYASQSAASAGITSLVCMPNTDPIIDNVSMVELVQRKVRKESDVKIFSTASITKQLKGKELTEFGLLKEAGAVGLTDAIKAVDDATVMMRALKYASAFDMLLMQHPEEKSLSQSGSMNSGALSTKLGIKGIPEEAEVIQVDRDLRLAEMTNGRIHFFNITTFLALNSITIAKKRGVKVTCSTSPHYFNLCEEDIKKWRTYAKVSPPLRNIKNMNAIKTAILNNEIDCITSDHSPHDTDSKRLPFEQASSGVIGFESLLPLTLKLINDKPYGFNVCQQYGCITSMMVKKDTLERFKKSDYLDLNYVGSKGQKIEVRFSLDGFENEFKKISGK